MLACCPLVFAEPEIYRLFSRKNMNEGGAAGGGSAIAHGEAVVVSADEPEKTKKDGCC